MPYGNSLRPDELAVGGTSPMNTNFTASPSSMTQQRVMVRRVTRSSPDSDDTYPGDDGDEHSLRDDQFLVSDRSENKFYGSLPGAAGSATSNPVPGLGNLSRRLQVMIVFPVVLGTDCNFRL